MPPLSYLDFHLFFVLPPLFALLVVGRFRRRRVDRLDLLGLGLIVVLALGYTIPWDNYLIAVGVWEYAPGTVALWIWHAPVEEYAFIVLQSVMTALWLHRLGPFRASVSITRLDRVLGLLAGGAVGVLGAVLLPVPSTFYLGATLAWAGPVLALQWGFGWPYLWRVRRRVALAVFVPTLYFATADRIAIATGVWSFSPRYTTGIAVFGLPIEEGAFFLLTNLFVVQGLVLFEWVVERWT